MSFLCVSTLCACARVHIACAGAACAGFAGRPPVAVQWTLTASSVPLSAVAARLLAGSISMIFFTYVFVNMGMVSGILPVVGVPLPLVSYGGTALVTLVLGGGILMSVQNHRKLVQT